MNKLLKYLIAAVIVLLIIAIAGKKAGWYGQGDTIKVAIEKAERRTIVETVSANGKIEPEVEIKISSDVSGEVVELNVKEGDRVQAGDVLVKIKPDLYLSSVDKMNAALNGARAGLANDSARLSQVKAQFIEAELNFKRSTKLWNEKVVSDADYETNKTRFDVATAEVEAARQAVKASAYNVKSMEASLKEANENFAKTTIKAPVAGTVYQLIVEKGDRVVGTSMMEGTAMMRIANLNEMEVSVEVNENDIVRVAMNDTAEIEVDAYLGRKFMGIVTEIANAARVLGMDADQVTNFIVKIRIIQDSYKYLVNEKNPYPFRPGMSGTVDIRTDRIENVIAVPIQAVTTRDEPVDEDEKKPDEEGKKEKKNDDRKIKVSHSPVKKEKKNDRPDECLFLFDGGISRLVKVKTGIQDNEYIQIVNGLEDGKEVITAPYSAVAKLLKEGSPVEKVEKKELWGEKYEIRN